MMDNQLFFGFKHIGFRHETYFTEVQILHMADDMSNRDFWGTFHRFHAIRRWGYSFALEQSNTQRDREHLEL